MGVQVGVASKTWSRVAIGVAVVLIAVIALIVLSDHTSTPARPQPSHALLTASEREHLRQQILAGNRRLADQPLDARSESATAPVDAGAHASPPGDVEAPDAFVPMFHGDTPALLEYRTRTFDIANAIVDECMAQTKDGGMRFEVRYDIIADDEAGGLFESVSFPPATNNSGPDTIECVTERMLGAALPAPPDDIARFHFGVEVIVNLADAG